MDFPVNDFGSGIGRGVKMSLLPGVKYEEYTSVLVIQFTLEKISREGK